MGPGLLGLVFLGIVGPAQVVRAPSLLATEIGGGYYEPAAGAASRLLAQLGAHRCAAGTISESTVEGVPFVGQIALDAGTLLAVPVEAALEPGRPIVGATILVTDVQAARRFASVPPGRQPAFEEDWRGRFVRVSPSRAHGLWLEFLEPGANGQCAS